MPTSHCVNLMLERTANTLRLCLGSPQGIAIRFRSLSSRLPSCLQLSSNFYKPKFEEKPRRIKNLIVAMEWKPNGMAPGGGGMAPEAAGPLPATAVEQLRAIFRMMGGSDAAGMPSTTVWELWRAMELDVDDPNEQARLQAAASEVRRSAMVEMVQAGSAPLVLKKRTLGMLAHEDGLQEG